MDDVIRRFELIKTQDRRNKISSPFDASLDEYLFIHERMPLKDVDVYLSESSELSLLIADSPNGLTVLSLLSRFIKGKKKFWKMSTFRCVAIGEFKNILRMMLEFAEMLHYFPFIDTLELSFTKKISISDLSHFLSYIGQPPYIKKLTISLPVDKEYPERKKKCQKLLDSDFFLESFFPYLKEVTITFRVFNFDITVQYFDYLLPDVEALNLNFEHHETNLIPDECFCQTLIKLFNVVVLKRSLKTLRLSITSSNFCKDFENVLGGCLRKLDKNIAFSFIVPSFIKKTASILISPFFANLEHLSVSIGTWEKLDRFLSDIRSSCPLLKTMQLLILGSGESNLCFEEFAPFYKMERFYWLDIKLEKFYLQISGRDQNSNGLKTQIFCEYFAQKLKIPSNFVESFKFRCSENEFSVILKGPDNVKRGFSIHNIFFIGANIFGLNLIGSAVLCTSLKRLKVEAALLYNKKVSDFIMSQTRLMHLDLNLKEGCSQFNILPTLLHLKKLVKLKITSSCPFELIFKPQLVQACKTLPFLTYIMLKADKDVTNIKSRQFRHISKRKRLILIARAIRAAICNHTRRMRKGIFSHVLEFMI